MPTLSQVSRETQTVFKWIGIILGVLVILFLILNIKNALFPSPPPPPNVAFGKLQSIDFPASISNRQFTYSIDTISGTLPSFSTAERVYKISEPSPDLLSLAKAQELAQGVGFTNKPSEISENVYQWIDNSGRALTMNILTYDFNLSSNFLFKSNLSNFKDTNLAISTSQNFLQNLNLQPQDMDETKTTTDLLSVKNYKLAPADPSTSQVIRVNLYQKPINDLSIYYPNLISPMNFLVGGNSQGPQVLEANFFHQNVSDSFATYPIKTASEALVQLKKGEAYISQAPRNSRISIKNVALGYYISEGKQKYLMPLIIFSGDNFRAFVSAVKDEWTTASK